MALVDLTLFKQHVRADDFGSDDAVLQFYLDAAVEAVITATNRTEAELLAMGDGTTLPKPLQQAAMMLAAHWYNQREAVSGTQMHEVPASLMALVKPFRKLADDSGEDD